jgi:peptidylprolyl isomerase
MKKAGLAIIMAGVVLSASKCNKEGGSAESNGIDTLATESGLKYVIWKKGDGDQPAGGDKVSVHYAGRLSTGEPFDNSYDRGQPFQFPLGQGRVIKGWDEGIAKLNVGDSATLIIPPDLGYGPTDRPNIPGNSTLIFDVQLMDVQKRVVPKRYDVSGKEKQTTESGLEYIKLNETEGLQAEDGKTVSVHYSGYLLDGTMFDSSVERGQPISFPLGQGRVIKGWDEGIALLKVGEKAQLTIPPTLGYGERAMGPIPANSTLIFDVELVDVK